MLRFGSLVRILCLVTVSGCATTASEHYAKLQDRSGCLSDLRKINTLGAPVLSAFSKDPIEGNFSDETCVVTGAVRSSWVPLRIKAASTIQKIRVRMFTKAKGVGFGGEFKLAIPVLNLVGANGAIKTFDAPKFERVNNKWTGDRFFFDFTVPDLVAGQIYGVILTTDNRNIGQQLTKETATNYGACVGGGVCLEDDVSLFIGPFGEVEVSLLK